MCELLWFCFNRSRQRQVVLFGTVGVVVVLDVLLVVLDAEEPPLLDKTCKPKQVAGTSFDATDLFGIFSSKQALAPLVMKPARVLVGAANWQRQ